MIHDLDITLNRLLVAELERIPGCPVRDPEQVTFDSPVIVEQAQDGEARVNLYLFSVRENREMRDEGFRRKPMNRQEQTVGVQRPPVRMDLSYLVSAHAGEDPATEHRLLSHVLSVLLRFEAIPAPLLTGALEGLGANAVLLSVAQPDQASDPASLWQALGGKMRPALILVVTAPFDVHRTEWTKVAREAVLALVQGSLNQEAGRPIGLSRVQASVAGIVLDQQTEQPQEGVLVQAEGYGEGTRTDDTGFFCLLNLPPGEQTLQFKKRGYRVLETRVTVQASGRLDEIEPMVIALRRMDDDERAEEAAALATAARNVPLLVEMGRSYRATLTGTLRTVDGEPAAYIPVRVGKQRTATDADGVYSFFNLPPGDHTVIAELPGFGEVVVAPQEPSPDAPPAAAEKPPTTLTLRFPARQAAGAGAESPGEGGARSRRR
ncbi:MAG TPA: Pvc16 family protein [Chthonomonadaceae bacterium]|nr:Pvc16 family protein [Chthonomonadaceae bacterium]